MTNEERDIMISRYLAGGMAPSEREEFVRQADTDAALGTELRAERMVRGAIGAERAAMPGPSAESRVRFMSMLGAVTAEIEGPGGSGGNTAPAGGGSSPLRYLAGKGGMRAMIAAGSLVAVIVGAVFLAPRFAGTSAGDRPGAQPSRTPQAVQAPAATPPAAMPQAPTANAPAATAPDAAVNTERPAEIAPNPTRSTSEPRSRASRTAAAGTTSERPAVKSSAAKGTRGTVLEGTKLDINKRDPVISGHK